VVAGVLDTYCTHSMPSSVHSLRSTLGTDAPSLGLLRAGAWGAHRGGRMELRMSSVADGAPLPSARALPRPVRGSCSVLTCGPAARRHFDHFGTARAYQHGVVVAHETVMGRDHHRGLAVSKCPPRFEWTFQRTRVHRGKPYCPPSWRPFGEGRSCCSRRWRRAPPCSPRCPR
jgi:hypothetical protein